jgi:hypothetical protein
MPYKTTRHTTIHIFIVAKTSTQKLSVQSNIIKKNAEALLDASKEIGLEVNSEKTKYWVEQKVFAFFK